MRSWTTITSTIAWLLVTTAAVRAAPLTSLNNETYPLIRADDPSYVGQFWPANAANPGFQAGAGTPAGTGLFSFHVDTGWGNLTYSPTNPNSSNHDSYPNPGSFQLNADIYPNGAAYTGGGPSDNYIRVTADLGGGEKVLMYSTTLTAFGFEATDPQFEFIFTQTAPPSSDPLALSPLIPVGSQIGVRLTMNDSGFNAASANPFAVSFVDGSASDEDNGFVKAFQIELPVPEPGTGTLLSIGMAGLFGVAVWTRRAERRRAAGPTRAAPENDSGDTVPPNADGEMLCSRETFGDSGRNGLSRDREPEETSGGKSAARTARLDSTRLKSQSNCLCQSYSESVNNMKTNWYGIGCSYPTLATVATSQPRARVGKNGRRLVKFLGTGLVFILCLAVLVPKSRASLVLKINDGITAVTVTDQGVGDINPVAGGVAYFGSDANYTIFLSSGQSKPAQGSATLPYLSLVVTVTPVLGGTLTAELTDTDFTQVPFEFYSSIGGTNGGGTVTMKTYADSSNAEFGIGPSMLLSSLGPYTSPPSPISAPPFGGDELVAPTNGTPYSLTIVTTVTDVPGDGSILSTSQLKAVADPVPEPGAIALMVLGGLALVGVKARRFLPRLRPRIANRTVTG